MLEELACFASAILSSACNCGSTSSIDMETLIDHICEEADQLKNCCAKLQGKDSEGKPKSTGDQALAATGSNGKPKCRKGKCHSCGKAGHWACECRSPKKEEKDSDHTPKPEMKPVISMNAVATNNKNADSCWVAELNGEVIHLDDVALIDESNWLYEEGETAATVITPFSDDQGEHVELYDSGTTHHISPYQSNFST